MTLLSLCVCVGKKERSIYTFIEVGRGRRKEREEDGWRKES